LNKNKPEGTIKVKVGKQFYVISGTGDYNGETYVKGLGKISYPSRQIMLDMEGGLKNDLYSGKFDVTLIVPSGLFLFNNVDPVMVTGSC
jgi:hypothetical protein